MAFVIKFATPRLFRRFLINSLYRVPLPLPLANWDAQLTGSRFRAPQISKVQRLSYQLQRVQRASTKSAARFSRREPVQPQHLFTVSNECLFFLILAGSALHTPWCQDFLFVCGLRAVFALLNSPTRVKGM